MFFQGGSLEYKKYHSILSIRRQRLQKQVMKMEKSIRKGVQNRNNNMNETLEDKVPIQYSSHVFYLAYYGITIIFVFYFNQRRRCFLIFI